MAVVIKTFATPGGKYVYDRETMSLLSVNDAEFEVCKRIEVGEANDEDWKIVERYTQQGYLKETKLKKIEHGATRYMRHNLDSRISQLTMQVTQGCNLRCSYCAYGGNYENQRTHSNKSMSLEMMKKCVDFAMARSRGVDVLTFGFYGGEPLLEIENIKACVAYIKDVYRGRGVSYTITTNGTIFNDDMIQFFEENDISILISLDGPKHIHDRNRIFENGQGSFDKIMENLLYIRENCPSFFGKIGFTTVVAPGDDFSCVNEYFDASDVISENRASYSTVSSYSAKEDIWYDDAYIMTYKYNHMKVLLAALGLSDKKTLSKLFLTNMGDVERFYDYLSKIPIAEAAHPGGPCLPGVMRPFVSIDGSIYPCERLSEDSEAMKIGHIDTGFDMDKVNAALNVGKLTEAECMSCWIFQRCGLCLGACDGGDKLSKEVRLKNCESQIYNTLDQLKTICLLMENGYDFRYKFSLSERQV